MDATTSLGSEGLTELTTLHTTTTSVYQPINLYQKLIDLPPSQQQQQQPITPIHLIYYNTNIDMKLEVVPPGTHIYQEELKNSLKSPRRRSPSKIFTKLVKRDSDTTVLNHAYQVKRALMESVREVNNSTDDCLDYGSDSENESCSSAASSPTRSPTTCCSIITNRNQFDESYTIGPLIGEGSTCKVYCATNKKDKKKYAAKVIPTKKIFKKDFKLVSKEIGIIKSLDHPNIIKLHDTYITLENVYIIMDFVDGKELFDEILEKRILSEDYAKSITKQIIGALLYLHNNRHTAIAHRDLKPENIKFSSRTNSIKLLDFGFAGYLNNNSKPNDPSLSPSSSSPSSSADRIGTLGYEAPEIVTGNSNITCKVDMWALGVITYIMLCGYPPFFSQQEYREDNYLNYYPFWLLFNEDTAYLRESIIDSKFDFSSDHWTSVSDDAKHFIASLLKVNVDERMSALEAVSHPWLLSRDLSSATVSPSTPLSPSPPSPLSLSVSTDDNNESSE
ncbi:hypothetical protein DFA_05980 [Cavenderia fasciculata]|uniref:non-specific serine/threonine protein kinase n=1 Tax=Cavenderia fasciculata TaxID=261658 RepID=F4PJS0_CACFS|nr:uncharacterized protein DFA_05980 [Cavenderia fasciculata]EGG23844.1 hypothetical protein DFA_05980 [Cavenderia fasciculata]|eukprot:XP_004361695.1 hypothetical protein DFA_05980 [Cavenderia fasciculata]